MGHDESLENLPATSKQQTSHGSTLEDKTIRSASVNTKISHCTKKLLLYK